MRTLLRAAGLAAIYLLVLSSLKPADVALGAVLAIAVLVGLRPRDPSRPGARPSPSLGAAAAVFLGTAAEIARGSWRVARLCLGRPSRPGLVEIPRGERSDRNLALWAILTGDAPDEVVVDVDDERDVLIVHLADAHDPDAVRAAHRGRERRQRKVVA